jgi:hypothetical protein
VLRGISEQKKEEIMGTWGKLFDDEELCSLHSIDKILSPLTNSVTSYYSASSYPITASFHIISN